MRRTALRAVTVLLAGAATAGALTTPPTASAATVSPARCGGDFFTVSAANFLRDYGVHQGAVRLDETHARLPFRPRMMAMATQVGDSAAYSKEFVAVTPAGDLRWVDAHAYTDRAGHRRHTISTRRLAGGWRHLSNLAVVATFTAASEDVAGLRVYGTSPDGALHLSTFDGRFRSTGHRVVMRGLAGTTSLSSSVGVDQPQGRDVLLATSRSGSLQEIDVTRTQRPVATRTALQRHGWSRTQGLGPAYCDLDESHVHGYLRTERSGRLSLYSDTHLWDRKGNDIRRIGAVRGHYIGRIIAPGL